MKTALIFGATGSIGSYIFKNLKDFHIFGTTKTANTGITGQSIKVDLGFTNIRKYK